MDTPARLEAAANGKSRFVISDFTGYPADKWSLGILLFLCLSRFFEITMGVWNYALNECHSAL